MGCTASTSLPLPKHRAKKMRSSPRNGTKQKKSSPILRFDDEVNHGASFSSHVSIDHNSSGNFFSGKQGAKSPHRPRRTSRAETAESEESRISNMASENPLFGTKSSSGSIGHEEARRVRKGSRHGGETSRPPLPPRKDSDDKHRNSKPSNSRSGSSSKHSSNRRGSGSKHSSNRRGSSSKHSKRSKRRDEDRYFDGEERPEFESVEGSKLRKTGPMARSRERVMDYFRRASGSSSGSSALSLYSGPMDFPKPPPRPAQAAY